MHGQLFLSVSASDFKTNAQTGRCIPHVTDKGSPTRRIREVSAKNQRGRHDRNLEVLISPLCKHGSFMIY